MAGKAGTGQSELLLAPGERGALNIDRHSLLGDDSGLDAMSSVDAIHPGGSGYADGGTVDQHGASGSWDDENKTQHWLDLISHAADSATIRDSHRLESRFLSGLSSQVLGQDDSGRPQLGRRPGLVDEALALPSAVMPLLHAGAHAILKDPARDPGTGVPNSDDGLDGLRASADRLLAPPEWSQQAAQRVDQLHQGVQHAMHLSNPQGFLEHLADAGGMMVGQLPLPGKAEQLAVKSLWGGLKAVPRAIGEYLGPTIRPSAGAYGTGAVAGGVMGSLGDEAPKPEGDW